MPAAVQVMAWHKGKRFGEVVPGTGALAARGAMRVGGRVLCGAEMAKGTGWTKHWPIS